MSRVIKFRVFDRVSRQMSPPFSLFGEFTMLGAVFAWLDHVRKVADGTCGLLQLNDIEVVQFTGLHDVNGTEIYEGHIVECDEHFYYEISWSDTHHSWYASECGGIDDLPAEIKVIGNIYQNSDLLESAK